MLYVIDENNETYYENNDDGRVIPDSGFFFGRGVFETMPIINRKVLFLRQHLERLWRGISVLGVVNSIYEKFLNENYINGFINRYELCDCVIKVVVTEMNIVISTRQKSYNKEDYIRGFSLKISEMKRNPYSHTCCIKSLNYIDSILEKELAVKEGHQEVLFFNTRDELAECSSSNIFFIRDGRIFTPELSCGILDGIIRSWVLKNYDITEGRYFRDDLIKADEVFLTNSVMGIMKVNNIAGIRSYEETNLFRRIIESYEQICCGIG